MLPSLYLLINLHFCLSNNFTLIFEKLSYFISATLGSIWDLYFDLFVVSAMFSDTCIKPFFFLPMTAQFPQTIKIRVFKNKLPYFGGLEIFAYLKLSNTQKKRQKTRGIFGAFVLVSIFFWNGSIFVKCKYIFGEFNRYSSGLFISCETNARLNVKTLSI